MTKLILQCGACGERFSGINDEMAKVHSHFVNPEKKATAKEKRQAMVNNICRYVETDELENAIHEAVKAMAYGKTDSWKGYARRVYKTLKTMMEKGNDTQTRGDFLQATIYLNLHV